MKTCKECGLPKPLDQFNKHAPSKDGLHPRCKECRAAYNRKLYLKNGRHPYDPAYERKRRLQRKYGITVEAWDAMFKAQNGLCKICVERPAEVVDHCHTRGNVRSLLCSPCNTAIGLMLENVSILQNAISYLQSFGTLPER